jgi:N6-L-threonylcarbamoyladenine synthase
VRLLAIESSCDETAAAVIEDGRHICSNVVASQVDLHARYGGVVPEVASRQHVLNIIPVIEQALEEAEQSLADLDAVAVTNGPGLAGSLLVGLNAAKAIAWARDLPLVGVNHLEGHIYANWLFQDEGSREPEPRFPALCLIVSGGHTDLVLMREHGHFQRVGTTRDDAAGEAFDKVARLLGLGFPGGPAIEQEAAGIDKPVLSLPRAWLRGTWDFSFSGLKTAVLRLMEDPAHPPAQQIAAAFQQSVVDVLSAKTCRLARELGVAELLVAGGVASNTALRAALCKRSPVPVRIPPPWLCTDNAAMIGACGHYRFQRGERAALDLDILPGMHFLDEPDPVFDKSVPLAKTAG